MVLKHFYGVLMRGGTSRGLFLKEDDIFGLENLDKVLLNVFGSGSSSQVDGVGGGFTHTSKVMIIGKSADAGRDVEYTFGQVSVDKLFIDWTGNCGNLTFAVAPFAVDEKLVKAEDGVALVRMYNRNTRKRVDAKVLVRNGATVYEGDYMIDGVLNPGSRIETIWHRPGGAVTGKLLPTGSPVDTLTLDGKKVQVSIVDAANPVVFVKAADVGMTGLETPSEIDEAKLHTIEKLRSIAAAAIGLVQNPEEATAKSPHFPFMCILGPRENFKTHSGRVVTRDEYDIAVRLFSMQKMHHACAVTAAICIAAASQIDGTLVHDSVEEKSQSVKIAHPKGLMKLVVKASSKDVEEVSVSSTARRIMAGQVYYL